MPKDLWELCLSQLAESLPKEEYNTWIRPLQPSFADDERVLFLLAPNSFVVDWVESKYLERIRGLVQTRLPDDAPVVKLKVGSAKSAQTPSFVQQSHVAPVVPNEVQLTAPAILTRSGIAPAFATDAPSSPVIHSSRLDPHFTFKNFVEGKSNRMAAAAAMQVAENPGTSGYNPLLLYGGVGLGKTHLMHAVGNALQERRPGARVVYLSSERFVQDMVNALRNKTISEFQRFYRSLDALLVDDIQFFAGKGQSQEEFFHTFNTLMERGQQIILTCDKFPKEIDGLEERLKSRFGWGLSQPLEPPELETRMAILKRKAGDDGVFLPDDAALLISQRIQSNVRELEGVLKRVVVHSRFTGQPISVGLVKDALRDVFAVQARLVDLDNIQKIVADYFRLKINDLLSPKRNRSVARPRQIAMALAKELTAKSYPEIGEAFGNRDHTTVLHACRKVAELRTTSPDIERDYQNLLRTLTS